MYIMWKVERTQRRAVGAAALALALVAPGAGARTSQTHITSVTLSSSSVMGGTPVEGRVTLNRAASGSGITVKLWSNNSAATVPATVPIPGGAASAPFAVATNTGAAATVTISAAYGGGTQSAALTVTSPAPASR